MLALEVDRNLDLALFSRFLYQQGIAHRINEAGEQQQLWVTNIHDQDRVQQFYAAWQSGELRLEAGSNMPRQGPSTLQRLLNSVWRMPVTGSFVHHVIVVPRHHGSGRRRPECLVCGH